MRALDTALHGAGLPYGYAITVWSTGATVTGAQGKPSIASVFLFAAGATGAYGVLRVLTKQAEGDAQNLLTRSPPPCPCRSYPPCCDRACHRVRRPDRADPKRCDLVPGFVRRDPPLLRRLERGDGAARARGLGGR